MVKFQKINDQVSVAPQIAPEDAADIAAAGFRSIVCHRPDGEAADQPSFAEVEAAARAAGLEVAYQPVALGSVSEAHADAFGRLLDTLPGPVFAYCRSGTRSAMVHALLADKRRG